MDLMVLNQHHKHNSMLSIKYLHASTCEFCDNNFKVILKCHTKFNCFYMYFANTSHLSYKQFQQIIFRINVAQSLSDNYYK